MNIPDIEAQCRNAKARGDARITLPTVIVLKLLAQAKELAAMPQLARDAAKEMAR